MKQTNIYIYIYIDIAHLKTSVKYSKHNCKKKLNICKTDGSVLTLSLRGNRQFIYLFKDPKSGRAELFFAYAMQAELQNIVEKTKNYHRTTCGYNN